MPGQTVRPAAQDGLMGVVDTAQATNAAQGTNYKEETHTPQKDLKGDEECASAYGDDDESEQEIHTEEPEVSGLTATLEKLDSKWAVRWDALQEQLQ